MPAKELFKDSDKKFRLLFEDHPQPMWVTEPETGKILEANAAARTLYEYSPEEFRNLTLKELEAPPDGSEPASAAPAPAGVRIWRHRTQAGRLIDIEAALHEISYGGAAADLAVLMDITGRRRLEDQLRQAQ
jgi:hypothetical protein